MNSGKVIIAVVAGAAIGVALGILFAPDKGSETRKKISKKGTDTLDGLKDKFDSLLESLNEKLEMIKEEEEELHEKAEKALKRNIAE